MICHKDGTIIQKKSHSRMQSFLYRFFLGRIVLKVLTARWISRLGGFYMNTRFSKIHIKRFIKKNAIDMSRYEVKKYRSYNDFFTRKLNEMPPLLDGLISPCDGKLSVYPITEDATFKIKGSYYTVYELLKDEVLAKDYHGGLLLVFRLSVDDYHRYSYIDEGYHQTNVYIPGKFHTVHPIAFTKYKVFKENARSYTVIETKHLKKIVQMEVGALMVGKIKNHYQTHDCKPLEEKGMFLFGGSTICLFLEKDAVSVDKVYFEHTENDIETKVTLGEKIGVYI